MPSVNDLGRQTKLENPGVYDDYDDYEVGMAIKAEHPGQFDDFTDSALSVKSSGQLSAQLSGQLARYSNSESLTHTQIEAVKDYYKPSRGRLTSWWQTGKSQKRTELLTSLNQEQRLVIEQGAMLEKAVMEGKKSEIDFQMYVAQNALVLLSIQHEAQMIEQSMATGLTKENDQAWRTAELLSKAKINEHQQITDIDLEARWEESRQDHEAADMAELTPQRLIKKLTKELEELYTERYNIEHSDKPEQVKKPMLARYDKNIESLEARIDAQQG